MRRGGILPPARAASQTGARPGACYHVTSRCANREFFLRGREEFALGLLRRAAAFSGVELLDFALMGNHFHLLVRVPERAPVSDDELARRVVALYGETRGDRLQKSASKVPLPFSSA